MKFLVLKSLIYSFLYMVVVSLIPFAGVPITTKNMVPLFICVAAISFLGNLAMERFEQFIKLKKQNEQTCK